MTDPTDAPVPSSRSSLAVRAVTAPLSLGQWLGHNGRAILGGVVILADILLLVIDLAHHEPVTMPDAILHLGMFVAGLALIDRERVADILLAWKGGKP